MKSCARLSRLVRLPLRVYSRDEYRQMLLQGATRPGAAPALPDRGYCRDQGRLAFATEGVDVVLHAAAMKHVPACEYNPFEAVKTNVLGLQNVIECAMRVNAERVVAISTDKVANPTNTMGATKLLGERLMMAANRYKGSRRTIFNCVRFGNVLGSRGSVVPLFRRQIRGGPRYRHRPACDPILHVDPTGGPACSGSGRNPLGGYTFVLKMPVVRIWDLAEVMINLYTKSGQPPVEIQEIGLRPGEKLFEELIDHGRGGACVRVRRSSSPSLQYWNPFLPPPAMGAGPPRNWHGTPPRTSRARSSEIRHLLEAAGQIPELGAEPVSLVGVDFES